MVELKQNGCVPEIYITWYSSRYKEPLYVLSSLAVVSVQCGKMLVGLVAVRRRFSAMLGRDRNYFFGYFLIRFTSIMPIGL